jgi:hypothetical protein
MSRNLGALTSWNPVGLFRPVMGQLYLYLYVMRNHIHSLNLFPAAVSHAVPFPRDTHNVKQVRWEEGLTLRLYIFSI